MKLKVGDLIAFKKYEDMTEEEQFGISKEFFPEIGKVSEACDSTNYFKIEGEPYTFSKGSIDHIIGNEDKDEINVGDEVLIKITVGEIKGDNIWASWIGKDDVVKVLKHKDERFILQEDHYGMYVTDSKTLSLEKSKAKVYNSRNEANDEAVDMHLNTWEVIPYGA